ncbi:ABC transporter substrate-binding protein [Beijerinckia indica]|nr:ABC transporter substrate-binding protein [Beijerinckia indica]
MNAAEALTIRIGVAATGVGNRQFVGSGTIAVLHSEHYLEEEFKNDPDIKIEWFFFKGAGPAVNEALVNKQLDFAMQGDLPAIIGRANGLKTKLLAANDVRANIYLAVASKSGVTTIEDLKGRKVAQFRGTNMQIPVDKILAAHGLKETDIKFINMDVGTTAAALASGDIDAAFGQADFIDYEQKGIAKIIYSTKGDDLGFTRHSHVLVTEDFEQAHPEITARIIKSWVKAAAWASDENHRDALYEIWGRSGYPLEIFRADFQDVPLKSRLSPLIDDFLVAAYATKINEAKAYRLLRNTTTVDGWFEPKYLKQALQDLGLDHYWTPNDAAGQPIVTQ